MRGTNLSVTGKQPERLAGFSERDTKQLDFWINDLIIRTHCLVKKWSTNSARDPQACFSFVNNSTRTQKTLLCFSAALPTSWTSQIYRWWRCLVTMLFWKLIFTMCLPVFKQRAAGWSRQLHETKWETAYGRRLLQKFTHHNKSASKTPTRVIHFLSWIIHGDSSVMEEEACI